MAQAKDPVCGMMVDTATAQHKSTYMGETYYFCSPGCKRDFDKEPEKYTKLQDKRGMQHEGGRNPVQEDIADQAQKGSPNRVPELPREREEKRPKAE